VNKHLSQWETIKKFAVVPDVLTIEADYLTPTLKVKRRNVEKRYADLIESFYKRNIKNKSGLKMQPIKKVAVLGAGVMGAQIAAHLANAGIPSYLLDIVPKELNEEEKRNGLTLQSPEVRNRIAREGLERAKKIKPSAFSSRSLKNLSR
jgi:hypothetical protein